MGEFPSGQRGQTVNLLAMPSVVRIHLPPPIRVVEMTARRKPLETLAVFFFPIQKFRSIFMDAKHLQDGFERPKEAFEGRLR